MRENDFWVANNGAAEYKIFPVPQALKIPFTEWRGEGKPVARRPRQERGVVPPNVVSSISQVPKIPVNGKFEGR